MCNVNNASISSTKAIVYQLCVAVDRCFEMLENEHVLIEHYGDVTTSKKEQVEVKHYQGNLSEGHENFWKTIYNWMHKSFEPTDYSSLILFTTQSIDENSLLHSWNDQSVVSKIEILEKIKYKAEERYLRVSSPQKNPKILDYQRHILEPENKDKLKKLLSRFLIAANSPGLLELCAKIKQKHLKHIIPNKADDCLNSLIGFISQAQSSVQSSWIISYSDFIKKCKELNASYGHGTIDFPRLKNKNFTTEDIMHCKPFLFVKKIEDIEHTARIEPAIRWYLEAQKIITQEFQLYETHPQRIANFQEELRDSFALKYNVACTNCDLDAVKASQRFFDEIMSASPPRFNGYHETPISFKNGVLHMQLDDEEYSLVWKVENGNE